MKNNKKLEQQSIQSSKKHQNQQINQQQSNILQHKTQTTSVNNEPNILVQNKKSRTSDVNCLKVERLQSELNNNQLNNLNITGLAKFNNFDNFAQVQIQHKQKPKQQVQLTDIQQQIKHFLNIEVSWPYKQSNKKQAMSIRQQWKDQINQLIYNKNNKIFLNSIEQTHPEIANYYYQVIEFPMHLHHILQRVQSYTYIGEIIKDLLLIPRNCHKFNEHNNEIRQMAYEFEEQILATVNQFLQHYESANYNLQNLHLKSLDDLYYMTLEQEFVPGKAPKILQSQKNKIRNQERQDVDIVVYKLQMLSPETQLYCLGCLLVELKSQEDMRQQMDIKQQENANVCIDLALLNKNTFWWFKELVCEQLIIEIGVQGDANVTEYLMNLQASDEQYVNIFKYVQKIQ